MSEDRREQIRLELLSHETEYLLDIWQNGDVGEWEKPVFDIIKEILLDRLGYLPAQSVETKVSIILERAESYLQRKEYDRAVSECEAAIQLSPNSSIAYYALGITYHETGQLENAIINYQKAIHLDPEDEDAWDIMLVVERELEEIFKTSISKQHLDHALELAYDDERDKALAECETAKPLLPSIAIAYNYLGLILHTLDQLEPAIDSYLKAVQLNPRFYAARENLANARVSWEEEQYLTFSKLSPAEAKEEITDFDESKIQESSEPIPQWMYLDKSAYFLAGWAGHRTRYGRSGYDPLDTDFELARTQGVIIRLLMTGKFRTRNPLYLLAMVFFGVLFITFGVVSFYPGDLYGIYLGVVECPYLFTGGLLLANVFLSLRALRSVENIDNGNPFF